MKEATRAMEQAARILLEGRKTEAIKQTQCPSVTGVDISIQPDEDGE